MKKITLKKIKNRVRKLLFQGGNISYSQAGEDMVLDCIFLGKKNGIYVDVGANHPTKSSNTYYFYKKGWRGVNIDALPEAIKLFSKQRRKDHNIEAGVSDTEGVLNFHSFTESSYNTFNEEIIEEIKKVTELKEVKNIPVKPLSKILTQLKVSKIDFMSIDVEGFDLNVIKSNNWNTFRPSVVIVEEFNHGMEISKSEIYKYMLTLGYVYFCSTVTNSFYIEQKFNNERFNNKSE